MVALASHPILTRAGIVTGHIWAWWLTELVTCVPGRVRRIWSERRSPIVFAFSRTGLSVSRQRREQRESIYRHQAKDWSEESADQIVGDLMHLELVGEPVAVELDDSVAISHVVSLPLAAKDDLAEVLHYEFDRLTPFQVDDVAFAFRRLTASPNGTQIPVQIAAARHDIVARAKQIAEAAGAMVADVRVEAPRSVAGHPDLPSLSIWSRPAASLPGRLNRWLIVVLLVLIGLTLFVHLETKTRSLALYQAELERLQIEADLVAALAASRDAATAQAGALAARDAARIAMLETIDDIATALPDSVWLESLRSQDDGIQITGYGTSIPDLIDRLEATQRFSAVQLVSPLVRDAELGIDRFSITAQMTLRDAP